VATNYSSKRKNDYDQSFILSLIVFRFYIGLMKQKMKAGSPFLFALIRLLNLFYGASALALFALSIWLWSIFNAFSIIEIVFMLLGLVEFFLVVLACTAK
jgi:hypothetical protein